MSLSYAAHINGDKVYDIATGYWIEAKQEAAASTGRMQWNVYLYDDEGAFVEKYAGGNFPENQADLWEFAGFDIVTSASTASWKVFTMYNHSSVTSGSGTSSTLKQYFSGEQGYAINADYAVIDVQPYSITENGTYTAPFSKAYSPVTVDVQEQPWQPLEDGYSNFWFELTDDTLSPWLNFSAKTENAVIDWGDGSGEVALDTLTPTHTYSKAGKYVVKCKGVTGIAKIADETKPEYFGCLRYVELNDEVVTISTSAFQSCLELKQCLAPNVTNIGTYAFMYCAKLEELSLIASTVAGSATRFCFGLKRLSLANTEVLGQYNAQYCLSITALTLPSTLQSITASAINNCPSLSEIHCQATTPPTLGVNVFTFLPNDFIIYVPVGTGETYKAAAGWSTYADHILEEGQTPNRAMLSRLAKAVETDTDEDMR
jgi:hypothetical protein